VEEAAMALEGQRKTEELASIVDVLTKIQTPYFCA
jgi:hypothetical protein